MDKNSLNFLKKEEIKRGESLGKELLVKPKLSFMMFLFPFILIPFYYQLKDYQNRFNFFLKEYLFTRNLTFQALEENLKFEEAKLFFKEKIYKDNKNNNLFKLFESQYEECLLFYNFYSQFLKKEISSSDAKKEILKREIDTLLIARKIFVLKDEPLIFSKKLEILLKEELLTS